MPDPDQLLAEAEDPSFARLVTRITVLPRTDEDYERLAVGAFRYFERRRREAKLRALADRRRAALATGDDEDVDRALRDTLDAIRSPGPSAAAGEPVDETLGRGEETTGGI